MKDRHEQPAQEALEKLIGQEIRRHRLANRVGIGMLAKRAGISKGFLSKIERGAKAPAISTLIRIATALNIRISALLEPKHRDQQVSLVRKEERPPALHYANAFGYRYCALARNVDWKHMEPFTISYPPNPKRRGKGLQHPGEEFLMVLRGNVIFTINGKEYSLRPGDSLYFDSSIPHWGRSAGGKQAEVLDISFVHKK